ncbi:hypothetical protein [Malikia sp.]|uniref:hypothetical protein n=1 Tax=Malikia sp. TaxID=2070706 RepID=UPI00261371B0|nr:hypothetical protein [Malikia sp.]MDD2729010.1 hypothetical protein [Malikia sp.]
MAEPHSHAHPDSPDHGHAGSPMPASAAIEPRPSWLLHSVAQRLLGAALVCVALVAAMLWATSAQG